MNEKEGVAARVVDHAVNLFEDGNRWPLLKQLFSVLKNEEMPSARSEVKTLLSNVRRRIERDYEPIVVCNVSQTFYSGVTSTNGKVIYPPFTKTPPKDITAAYQCVPGGKAMNGVGKKIAGLYFPSDKEGKDDLIYLVAQSSFKRQLASMELLLLARIQTAMSLGVLTSKGTKEQFDTMVSEVLLDFSKENHESAMRVFYRMEKLRDKYAHDYQKMEKRLEERIRKLEEESRKRKPPPNPS